MGVHVAGELERAEVPLLGERQFGQQLGDIRADEVPAEQLTEGWIGGLVLEAALNGAGWPADAGSIRAAMEQVKVDTKGLRGGPLEWSKDNHFRTRQYYRVYRWDSAKAAIVQAKDWTAYEVK